MRRSTPCYHSQRTPAGWLGSCDHCRAGALLFRRRCSLGLLRQRDYFFDVATSLQVSFDSTGLRRLQSETLTFVCTRDGRIVAERVRIEHTSTRKRADNGFEDREGHQAPITLRSRSKCKLQSAKLKLQNALPHRNGRFACCLRCDVADEGGVRIAVLAELVEAVGSAFGRDAREEAAGGLGIEKERETIKL